MKYLTFSFGNNKDKQQEEKEPQEKEKSTPNKFSN